MSQFCGWLSWPAESTFSTTGEIQFLTQIQADYTCILFAYGVRRNTSEHHQSDVLIEELFKKCLINDALCMLQVTTHYKIYRFERGPLWNVNSVE